MFDAYHKWLGIPKHQRPPTHYQLLGIGQDEADPEVIEEAALRQTAHIRTYQIGPHGTECTKLLNEISHARTVLLNPAKRKAYDATIPKRKPTVLIAPGAEQAVTDKVNPFAQLTPEDAPSPPPPPRTAVDANVTKKGPPLGLLLGIGGGAAALILATALVIVFTRGGDGKKEPGPIVQIDGQIKKKNDGAKNDDGAGKKDDSAVRKDDGAGKKDGLVDPKKDKNKIIPKVIDPSNVELKLKGVPFRQVATGNVTSAQATPDGRMVVTNGPDNTARAWSLTNKIAETFQFNDKTEFSSLGKRIALSKDGSKLLLGAMNQPFCMILYDTASGKELQRFVTKAGKGDAFHSVALSPDGLHALSSGNDFAVRLWDVASGQELRRLAQHNGAALHGVFMPDGTKALTSGQDGTLRMWDIASGQLLYKLEAPEERLDQIPCIAVSPNGDKVVCCCNDRTVRIFDVASKKQLSARKLPDRAWSVAFSSDGKMVAAGDDKGRVILLDAATWRPEIALKIGLSPVYSVEFLDQDRSLLVACDGVKIMDLSKTELAKEVKDPPPVPAALNAKKTDLMNFGKLSIDRISASEDGRIIAVLTNNRLLILDTQDKKPKPHPALKGQKLAVAVAPDGTHVAVGASDACYLVNTSDNRVTHKIPVQAPVQSVAFAPDSKTIVTGHGSKDTVCYLAAWGVEAGNAVKAKPLAVWDKPPAAVGFLGRGDQVYAFLNDNTLRRYDVGSEKEMDKLDLPDTSRGVPNTRFGPVPLVLKWDQMIYSESDERTLVISDFAGGMEKLPPAPEKIAALTACGKWRYLVAASEKRVHIFDRDPKVKKWLPALDVELERVNAVAGASQAPCLFTGGRDGILRRWDLEAKEPAVVVEGGDRLFPIDRVYYQAKEGPITAAALDHQGQFAAWADASGVMLRNLRSATISRNLGPETANAKVILFSPDGSRLAIACTDKKVRIWNFPADPKSPLTLELSHETPITALAFSSNSQMLVSGSNPTVQLWDLSNKGKLEKQFTGHGDDVLTVGLSNDNQWIYSACRAKSGIRWNRQTGLKEGSYRAGQPFGYAAIGWGNGGGKALGITNAHPLYLWDIEQDRKLRDYASLKQEVNRIGWSPCGAFAFVGYLNDWQVFEVQSGKERGHYEGHKGRITCLAMGPQAKVALSGDENGTLRIWMDKEDRIVAEAINIDKPPDPAKVADGPRDFATFKVKPKVDRVALSPDGQRVLTAGAPGVHEWDLKTGELLKTIVGPGRSGFLASTVAYLPDGKHAVYSIQQDSSLHLVDLSQDKEVGAFADGAHQITGASVDKYGKRLLTCGADGRLLLWNVEKRELIAKLHQLGNVESYLSVAFSPDGTRALAGTYQGYIQYWDVQKQTLIHTFKHNYNARAVSISANGVWGAAGTNAAKTGSDAILIMNLSAKNLGEHAKLPGKADSLVFLDNRHLLVAGPADKDKTVLLFDAFAKKLVYTHPEPVAVGHFAASKNGDMAVSVDLEGNLRVWPLMKMLGK